MSMYNLIEHSDNYLKTSGRLQQECRGKPALNGKDVNIDFPDDNDCAAFKFKPKITDQTGNDETEDVKIMVP